MENLNNLDLFYEGQSVICINVKPNSEGTVPPLIKDNKYIVSWVCNCGCKGIKVKESPEYVYEHWRFVPAQESIFPSLTFKEVIKETQKQTCLN